MATRLHGILLDGLNNPIINATVALIAKGNTITVLNGSEAIFRTDGSGAYNVTVQTGHYKVIIGPQGIEPYKAGEIVIYGDSPEGSLNGYLINGAPEELTPDVIKQVQQLVANSEEYALQAGRSAAAANADATDARNSKAAAATSASEALTYKNDSKTNADAAKQAQSSAAGSANTATKAVTTITNLKKDVEKLKSDTQTIKNSSVSETQAIKDAAVSETTALKDAAAASATKAANSATEAGKQAGNAGTSATNAKNDADRAKTEADRAESAANNAPEIQPLPDVWIPFNDSLDMITGFSPSYKKIVIGDDEITMPGDKIVKFKRASTATYINKSGEFVVAKIDEPRFEREGLLIEGQRTNYILNSLTVSKWGASSWLTISSSGVDSFGFTYGRFDVQSSNVGSTTSGNIAVAPSPRAFDVTGGEKYCTISCRCKCESDIDIRCRLRFENYDGTATSFIGDAYMNMQTLDITTTGGAANRITAKAVKDNATGWIFFEATIKALDTENMIGGQVQIAPSQRVGSFADGDHIIVATPQFEGGATASSFIISDTVAATRASDTVTVPIKNNIYSIPFTILCEVHKNWYKTPNAAPRVFDTSGYQTGAAIILGFGRSTDYDGFPYCDIGRANIRVNENASLEKMVMGMRVKADQLTCAISNGRISSETKTTWTYIQSSATIRIGGQTTTGQRHLFGHVRNFRVWHKALTDRELKESV
ncbi:tail protein [Escherichia phage Dru_SM1]